MANNTEANEQPPLGDLLKEGLVQGKTPSLTLISDSMAPLLQRGDRVGLQEISLNQLSPGHIITFVYPHRTAQLVTHRMAGIAQIDGKTKLITWADRTLMFDLPIDKDDVIGRVVWRTRNNRRLNLDGGRGAWLSNKLSKLATRELKRITRLHLGEDNLSEQAISRSEELRRENKSLVRVRILRRINFMWARILAAIVEILP